MRRRATAPRAGGNRRISCIVATRGGNTLCHRGGTGEGSACDWPTKKLGLLGLPIQTEALGWCLIWLRPSPILPRVDSLIGRLRGLYLGDLPWVPLIEISSQG